MTTPPHVGSDARFDDDRYWRFTRNSGLPYGTFGRTHWLFRDATLRDGAVALFTCVVGIVVLLLA